MTNPRFARTGSLRIASVTTIVQRFYVQPDYKILHLVAYIGHTFGLAAKEILHTLPLVSNSTGAVHIE